MTVEQKPLEKVRRFRLFRRKVKKPEVGFGPTLPQSLRQAWNFSKPYWTSPEDKWSKWLLLGGIAALTLGQVSTSFWFISWNDGFYNAFQTYHAAAAFQNLASFTAMSGVLIGVNVYQTLLTQKLQMKWRKFATSQLMSKWFGNKNHFRMESAARYGLNKETGVGQADNPDQRIADDVGATISGLLIQGTLLLNSVATITSFMGMLWRLSAYVPVHIMGHSIPGTMVMAALAYSAAGTAGMRYIGKPLIKLYRTQEQMEGNFRFALTRVREFSREIAQKATGPIEQKILDSKFSYIVDNWQDIMARTQRVNGFMYTYNQIAFIAPFAAAMPQYFKKVVSLGRVMQLGGAFGQVTGAFSVIVKSFSNIASLQASLDRLTFFNTALDNASDIAAQGMQLEMKPAPGLTVRGLTLSRKADERGAPDVPLIKAPLDLSFAPGDRVKITGPSASGKSTFLLAIQNLYPLSTGVAQWQENARIMCIPQRAYIPDLPLAGILTGAHSPEGPLSVNDFNNPGAVVTVRQMEQILREVGLAKLIPKLQEGFPRGQALLAELSGGEAQKLNLASILLRKPDILIQDESTSALDPESAKAYYELLARHLPNLLLLNVVHQADPTPYHTRHLHFQDGTLKEMPMPPSPPPPTPPAPLPPSPLSPSSLPPRPPPPAMRSHSGAPAQSWTPG